MGTAASAAARELQSAERGRAANRGHRQRRPASMSAPMLYLNMGGEMLYVLQQRLHTQRISADKTVQVMTEVTEALLAPRTLAWLFAEGSPPPGLAQLRPALERAALSSIVRLDAASMDKLFDLMAAMAKYQLATASGPRELLLATLNHLDAARDLAARSARALERVDACHGLLLATYGPMTHARLWQLRDECLRELREQRVRVSVLLRLGLQNQDASFNRLAQDYDERYEERRRELQERSVADEGLGAPGQLTLRGDRATLLGRNAYCSSYAGRAQGGQPAGGQAALLARSNRAMRLELESLGTQLGQEEAAPARPFSLQLFDNDGGCERAAPPDSAHEQRRPESGDGDEHSPLDYRRSLVQDVDSEFADDDVARGDAVDLMNLLDIV